MKRLYKRRLIEEPRKLNELVQNLLTHVLACVWRYHNKEQWLYKYAVRLHVETYGCIQVCTSILNTETHKQIGFHNKLFPKRLSQTLINLPSCQYDPIWYSWNWRPFANCLQGPRPSWVEDRGPVEVRSVKTQNSSELGIWMLHPLLEKSKTQLCDSS